MLIMVNNTLRILRCSSQYSYISWASLWLGYYACIEARTCRRIGAAWTYHAWSGLLHTAWKEAPKPAKITPSNWHRQPLIPLFLMIKWICSLTWEISSNSRFYYGCKLSQDTGEFGSHDDRDLSAKSENLSQDFQKTCRWWAWDLCWSGTMACTLLHLESDAMWRFGIFACSSLEQSFPFF